MLKEGVIVLTIQGRVKSKVIKKVTKDYLLEENQGWFFIDYVVKEVPLSTKFDVILEGESKRLISGPGLFTCKVITCLDQDGYRFKSIPEGYKTICKLEFNPIIPTVVKKSPLLDHWDYNPKAISIANSYDIELGISDFLMDDIYKILFPQIKRTLTEKNFEHQISKSDFINILQKSYKTHFNSAITILENLILLGKVTQKEDNELELADVEG
ncbi:hypothetical protein [Dinghuibacter silviterrae]|uniref:Uncharacterized protein n=1 Tax=Dinghuibacter silviterrae TaxID=1539049 RepID=A0A4R8DSD3_9BACT|nr:hypothetical protein [Dinghuibacter silviterrae]TDX01164.1 hypothetical protein EDB95_2195 [Dinghuibacter silviterrae]